MATLFATMLAFHFILLLSTLSHHYDAAPVSNSTSDSFCVAETNETCNNVTTYNIIESGYAQFLEVQLNLSSTQLRKNIIPTINNLNSQYPDGSIAFYPVPDSSSGNDVCKIIDTKLSSRSVQSGFNCPWEYKCDYDPRRIPQVMWLADCSQNSTWQCSCSDQAEDCNECIPMNRKCEPVYYPVPILYNNRCNPFSESGNWEWRHMKVAVACASSNEIAF